MTKFVAILSGKGGVGKTTIAVNLAMALRQFGRDITLIDSDIKTPNIALHLGSTDLPIYINHILKENRSVLDSIYRHPSGLKLIPASINYSDIQNVSFDTFASKINELNGKCEITIIDCAAGIGVDQVLDVAQHVLIVCTPDLISVTDAMRTIAYAESKKKTILGVILNKVKGLEYELSIDNIETMIERPIISVVSEDSNIPLSIRERQPLVLSHPNSKATHEIKKLAAKLIGDIYIEPKPIITEDNFLDKLQKNLGLK